MKFHKILWETPDSSKFAAILPKSADDMGL